MGLVLRPLIPWPIKGRQSSFLKKTENILGNEVYYRIM